MQHGLLKVQRRPTMAGKKEVANGWPYCIVCFRKPIFPNSQAKVEIGFVANYAQSFKQFIARSLSCPDGPSQATTWCASDRYPHPAHLDGFLLVIVLVDTDRIDPNRRSRLNRWTE